MYYSKGKFMKAERLISILILIQKNNKMTAKELAGKLEVSTRTIHRDIESISTLGIPIFTERGTNGGIKLLGDYKTTLTGLTNKELFSLFVPAGDKILEDLGLEKPKESTYLKLTSDSNIAQIKELENIKNYLYVDLSNWDDTITYNSKELLTLLQQALWSNSSIEYLYTKISENKIVLANPLGLVCKKGIWYLIALNNNIIKTYKLSSISKAKILNNTFTRPTDFNLENHWKSSTQNFRKTIPQYLFEFKVTQSTYHHIKARKFIKILFEKTIGNIIFLEIEFNDIWAGVEFAFTYGKNLEILSPPQAITEIQRKANEILSLYNSNL